MSALAQAGSPAAGAGSSSAVPAVCPPAGTADPHRLQLFVPGKPAPQGSRRYLGQHGGRGITVESSKAVAPWRADIRERVLAERRGAPPMTGPVQVDLMFVLPRPKSTPKRSTPPAVRRPDVDKLARAVLDALSSAGVWGDDAQVTRLVAVKRLALATERAGCWIRIAPAEDQRWLAEDVRFERAADAADRGPA